MGLRNAKRKIAKAKMKAAGVVQPNKSRYKNIDDAGNPVLQSRPSFFAKHWRDK